MAKAKFFSVAIAMALALSVGLAALAPGEVLANPPYWAKTYGGVDRDGAFSTQQTSDGGYIVAGETWSFGVGNADVWVLKIDANGNVAWQKTYGGTNGDSAYSIQETSEGGYIVAGYTASFGAGGTDVWVVKLDSAGNVTWQRTYGGASLDFANSIQQTQDSGYIVAGETWSFGVGNADVWVLKIDATGNVTWQKTYGGANDDAANSIQQTQDSGYIVAGYTDSFGAGSDDFWVLKLDVTGNVTWQKTYGGQYSDEAHSIQQTSGGGYIVAGETGSFGAGLENFWVLKLNANGNVTWQKTYGGGVLDNALSIQQTSEGGYIVAGWTLSFGAGDYDCWVLKLDVTGNVTWQKTYGGGGVDMAMSIQQTFGDYIVAGQTWSFGAGDCDAWVLKLNATGSIPDCPLGVPSDADISDTSVPDVSTEILGEDTDADIDSPEYETLETDSTIDTQCQYAPPPSTPMVPTTNQWGMVAMITLFGGLILWAVRRRRPISRTGS